MELVTLLSYTFVFLLAADFAPCEFSSRGASLAFRVVFGAAAPFLRRDVYCTMFLIPFATLCSFCPPSIQCGLDP